MTAHNLHVRVSDDPAQNLVQVNGQDITDAVCSLSWSSSARHGNTLRLDFLGIDRAEYRGQAEVKLSETTRRALLALGWNPPAGADGMITIPPGYLEVTALGDIAAGVRQFLPGQAVPPCEVGRL